MTREKRGIRPTDELIHHPSSTTTFVHLSIRSAMPKNDHSDTKHAYIVQWRQQHGVIIRAALHYNGGEVHRSWILREFWNMIGRERHSRPVLTTLRPRVFWWRTLYMDGEKWHGCQRGDTFLTGEFSGGQVSWATWKPRTSNLASEDLQLEWNNSIVFLMFSGIRSLASYRGHTKNPSNFSHRKHQPYVFVENTWLGFQLAGAAGSSSQMKSQPCISKKYVGPMFKVGPPGVALVSNNHILG